MIELLGGIVIGGVAGIYAKDKLFGTNTQSNNNQQELNILYKENEKFRNRNKELERQTEDLLSELNKVRKQAKASDDDYDDLEDELDKLKKELNQTT